MEAGRAAYVANCQSCHTDNLSGSGEAVPLAGRAFLASFGAKTTKELFDTVKSEMPLGAPGMLSDETYADIVAFMLHASGAATGTAALTPASAVRINTIATGTVPPDVANGIKLAQAPTGASSPGAKAAAAPAPGGNRQVIYGPDGKPLPGLLDGALGSFRPNNSLGVIKQGNIQELFPRDRCDAGQSFAQ